MAGPDGQPYRAKQVVFAVSPLGGARSASGQQVGGVKVTRVVEDPTPTKMTYDPGIRRPMRTAMWTMPNVDLVEEMVNMIRPRARTRPMSRC